MRLALFQAGQQSLRGHGRPVDLLDYMMSLAN